MDEFDPLTMDAKDKKKLKNLRPKTKMCEKFMRIVNPDDKSRSPIKDKALLREKAAKKQKAYGKTFREDASRRCKSYRDGYCKDAHHPWELSLQEQVGPQRKAKNLLAVIK